eukprot:TRINITY_DN14048_c0_g1_i1.p1 TRINITY_DN14048_c0_g1~~TRINITY_DN14048_c0_g1_i1.p1  ORF type:complete len:889 (-),score=197.01 TRINITY_DN14048_c0_g1_i1:213-2639(-)
MCTDLKQLRKQIDKENWDPDLQSFDIKNNKRIKLETIVTTNEVKQDVKITCLAQARPRKAKITTNSVSSNNETQSATEPIQNGFSSDPNENNQSNLLHPPIGLLVQSDPACQDKVYAMKGTDLVSPWKLAKIVEVKTWGKGKKYKVQFDSNSPKPEYKTVTLKQLANEAESSVCLPVGTRCIAVYKEDGKGDLYPAIVAERPKAVNNYRYLVFYDDGYASYLEHKDLRVVCKASNDVWLDVFPKRRDFIKQYLQKFPKRAMIKLEEDALVKTELRGNWYMARVFDIDTSLVKMTFPDGLGCEWIYRGSIRFEPMILLLEKDKEIVEDSTPESKEETKEQSIGGIISEVQIEGNNPVQYVDHICNKSCVDKFTYNPLEHKMSNPLRIPIYLGWRREVSTHKESERGGNWTVLYISPCGKRFRNLEEIHHYLRMTQSSLEIDFFAFDCWLNVMKEFIPNPDFLKMEDISHGKEDVAISAANNYDSTYPPFVEYTTEPNLKANVEIATDSNFLIGCDCTDDCSNTGKCACRQLTIQATKCDAGGRINKDAGYVNRRLQDVVLTGIYECNKTCKCSKTCLNKMVQFPIRSRLQVFKTENRGWGIRTLDDLPQGAFISNYVGNLYGGEEGNNQGTAFSDAYFADLDMIEVVEARKDGYESDVSDEGFNEDTSSKNSDDGKSELKQVTPEKSKINVQNEQKSEPKKDVTAENGELKHKSVRKYFGPDEEIFIMDAMSHGNIGRYLNHSCDPNVFVQNVFVKSHDLRFPNIAFFTFKFVPAGTELCWNYNYEVGTVENKQIVCNCGAKNCKGRLL